MSRPGTGPQYDEMDDQQYDVVVPDAAPTQAAPVRHGVPTSGSWSTSYSQPESQSSPSPYTPQGSAPTWANGTQKKPSWLASLPKGTVWGIGGLVAAALVLVLLLVSGVFSAKDADDSGPGNQATGQYEPDPSKGGKALRIIDKDSGISYDYLGEGWKDWSLGAVVENSSTVGEYIVTQPKVPTGGQFIAQVTSGPLNASFGNPGVGGYAQLAAQVEESVRGNYYPQPNKPSNQTEGPVTIDGRQGYQRTMDLTWDVEGYDSTGERVVVLLIDTGKGAPIFFYCSFPNTHAELYPLIEQVIASIKVDQ